MTHKFLPTTEEQDSSLESLRLKQTVLAYVTPKLGMEEASYCYCPVRNWAEETNSIKSISFFPFEE